MGIDDAQAGIAGIHLPTHFSSLLTIEPFEYRLMILKTAVRFGDRSQASESIDFSTDPHFTHLVITTFHATAWREGR